MRCVLPVVLACVAASSGCRWLGRSQELWKTDGTAAGTVRVARLPGGLWLTWMPPARVGEGVFFNLTDGRRANELWKSDGSEAGTRRIKDLSPGRAAGGLGARESLAALEGSLFFEFDDVEHGSELWKSDGTAGGTVLVKDIVPGSGGAWPRMLVAAGRRLYFVVGLGRAEGAISPGLWTSDGSADGTRLVQRLESPGGLAAVGDTLYFLDGRQVWKIDRGAEGATLVKEIPNGAVACVGSGGRLLVFNLTELWASDGTSEGTLLLKPVGALVQSSPVEAPFADVDGMVYFATAGPNEGPYGLWRSDGTPQGTTLLKEIRPAAGQRPDSPGGPPVRLTRVGREVFFAAHDEAHGYELWKSDGTADGTAMVTDLSPGSSSSSPRTLADVRGSLVYTATVDGVDGLWRSDGTPAGTVLVSRVRGRPNDWTTAGGYLYWLEMP